MTTPRAQAAIDFNAKLRLERKLLLKLRRFNARLAREYTDAVARGELPNFNESEDLLAKILNDHMNETGEIFRDRINSMVRSELKAVGTTTLSFSSVADEMIELKARKPLPVVVSRRYAASASAQARAVTATSRDQAREALDEARRISQDPGGSAVEEIEIASTSGAIFRRFLRGREVGIARLATQESAETAKLTQIEILRGEEPSISGGNASTGTKEWANLGDSKVRTPPDDAFNHLAAEQEVPINKPFIVSGEKLRFPGDQSLGASLGNVINCRCSATYDTEAVAERVQERATQAGTTPNQVIRDSSPERVRPIRPTAAPLEPPKVPKLSDIVGQQTPGIDPAFVRQLDDAWDAIPDKLKLALQDAGIEIRIADDLTRVGMGIDTHGVYLNGQRTLGVSTKAVDPGNVLLHEIGHALDELLPKIIDDIAGKRFASESKDLIGGWLKAGEKLDRIKLKEKRFSYYFGQSAESGGALRNVQESFAESFAQLMQAKSGKSLVTSSRAKILRGKQYRFAFKEHMSEIQKLLDGIL